ncbi:MAG: FIST N-terminal domain-containing protein, partial [Gammaproteobacteria bacterium]|nr:FIST N-terminal domain-containing protein [Gammaproteobacteria bacterium]
MDVNTPNRIRRSVSHFSQAEDAISDLANSLQSDNSAIVVLFVSPNYDTKQLSRAIVKYFPQQLVIGCSTAGEIGSSGYLEGSISAFSLPSNDFQVKVALFDKLSELDLKQADHISHSSKAEFENQLGKTCTADNTFALLLSDGLSLQEEVLVAGIYQGLGNIPLIGGSAGDGINFQKTWLYHQGEALSNRALLLLIHSKRRFKTFKTEHFTQVGSSHVVTESDPKNRIVWEIDAEPAAEF